MANRDWNITKIGSYRVDLYPGIGDDSPGWIWLNNGAGQTLCILRFYRDSSPLPVATVDPAKRSSTMVPYRMSDMPIVLDLLRQKTGIFYYEKKTVTGLPGETVAFISNSAKASG